MGREAVCHCQWGDEQGEVRVLLETYEIIVRGDIRRKHLIANLKAISADDDELTFVAGDDRVMLNLGSKLSASWAKALIEPPPTLARKLGIKPETRVKVIGILTDDELGNALSEALIVQQRPFDLMIACAENNLELDEILNVALPDLEAGIPIWIAYSKGAGHPISEHDVRDSFRGNGMIDTKVASVSTRLTALRFSRKK